MDKLIKIIRTIAALPIVGNLVLIAISFFPLILAFMSKVSLGWALIIGGLGMAAVCYFLKAKNVINILAPGQIPMWIVGVLITLAGVYSLVSNALG